VNLLEVSTERRDGSLVIVVAGELDVSTAPILQRELDRAAEEPSTTLRLDLSALRFMDSTGLQLVLSADSKSRATGRTLELVKGPQTVQRLFQVAGLEERLRFVEPS
jgi:anti-sigma B factor antagonist